jgi:hypothetical protein
MRLRDEFKIIILQQSACSPEVNVLDLGIWMSLQAEVESRHRRDPDGLAATVIEAWENLPAVTIKKIFHQMPIVLELIVESGGDNITVEDRRGCHDCRNEVGDLERFFLVDQKTSKRS